jgi:hypothetical protein
VSNLADLYLSDIRVQFAKLKDMADRAMAQLRDEELFATLDPETNSIAILVQHMAGNLRSRWTDFLTTDGEKPDRDRDSEFEVRAETTREELLSRWEEGWATLEHALATLGEADLLKTVLVRAEPHTVPQAIHRQLTHQAYHAGQIVQLAKHYAGDRWKTLSVPRGRTREMNTRLMGQPARTGA